MRVLIGVFFVLVGSLCPVAQAQDVIFLKSGQSAACEIEALTDNIVTFKMSSGSGSVQRTMGMKQVAYVEFDFEPGEEALFERRLEVDVETAEKWWDHHFAHLHRPRSRTAGWGIAYAYALLRKELESDSLHALRLFERIEERAWADEDIATAKRGRLQSLIALGELEKATEEAHAMVRETEDPELLIEVNYLLAKAEFAKLKDLEEEHPRWEVDDEVRPGRNELYHGTINQFLWPYLFHATRASAAARGLYAAAETYEFGGEPSRAVAAYTDLVQLYPDTEFGAEAATKLKEMADE